MDLINAIVLFLLLTPFYAVVTDYKKGKIKNYFIFPFLALSIMLTFFIEWFYQNYTNIIWLLIVTIFWFLFYKDNKWWAWDGKYIILIWLNSIIISYLLSWDTNIINGLFITIFWILFAYNIFFLLYHFSDVRKIKYEKNFWFKTDHSFFIISFIYLFSSFFSLYIWWSYIFIIIFLSIILMIPYLNKIKRVWVKYLLIVFAIWLCLYRQEYLTYAFIIWMFFSFIILQSYADQIFKVIDTIKIKLFEIKQWNILTRESISLIKKDTWFEFQESVLQGNEVFELIGKYKEVWKNPEITIYKELKIWIFMYIGYVLIIIYYINKNWVF